MNIVLRGPDANERWAASGTTSGTISSESTISLTYYHQFEQRISYSITDGGSPSAPQAVGVQFGQAVSPTIATSPTSYWFDATGSISFTTSKNGGIGERWINTTTSIPAISSATTVASYYRQYNVQISYSLVLGRNLTGPLKQRDRVLQFVLKVVYIVRVVEGLLLPAQLLCLHIVKRRAGFYL